MSPFAAFLLIAGGLIFAVVAAHLLWRIAVEPLIERMADYLAVRREFPRWFQ